MSPKHLRAGFQHCLQLNSGTRAHKPQTSNFTACGMPSGSSRSNHPGCNRPGCTGEDGPTAVNMIEARRQALALDLVAESSQPKVQWNGAASTWMLVSVASPLVAARLAGA